MKRRAINLATALSLMLLAALLLAWAYGRWRGAAVALRVGGGPERAPFVVVGGGGVFFLTREANRPADGSWTADVRRYRRVTIRRGGQTAGQTLVESTDTGFIPRRGRFGFRWFDGAGNGLRFRTPAGDVAACSINYRGVAAPAWAAAALTAAAPAAWIVGQLRRRRSAPRPTS